MNREEEISEMKAHLRIVEVSHQNAFGLYQLGKISLSKLLSALAEDLWDEGYRQVNWRKEVQGKNE